MHHKKHLSFTALRKSLSQHFRQIEDRRQSAKVDYSLHDCLMSGFAMTFFQDPSLLTFQKMIFFALNLLAFYVHQILELTDPLYYKVRYTKFTPHKEYWNQLRCTIRILIFSRWESLLQFILDPESGISP